MVIGEHLIAPGLYGIADRGVFIFLIDYCIVDHQLQVESMIKIDHTPHHTANITLLRETMTFPDPGGFVCTRAQDGLIEFVHLPLVIGITIGHLIDNWS